MKQHKRLLDERAGKGKGFNKRQELDSVEDQLDAAINATPGVECFRCGNPVDLSRDRHFRLTVCSLVEFRRNQDPSWQYFTPPTALRVEAGEVGVIALLEPPHAGELALCVNCANHFQTYMSAQEVED
jgi:hypothetical protein